MKIEKHTTILEPKFNVISFIESFDFFFRKFTNRNIVTVKFIKFDLFESVKHP